MKQLTVKDIKTIYLKVFRIKQINVNNETINKVKKKIYWPLRRILLISVVLRLR
jgi:hypothetical protein